MPASKLLRTAAFAAALAGGAAAGAVLGVPGVSGAQEDTTTTTEAPAGEGRTDGEVGRRCGPGPRPGLGLGLAAAAEAVGITEDELADALRDGSTIAEVAVAEGVDVQTVVDALVADAEARIDEQVAEGDLDEEEAAELKAELPERMADLVNGELPLRPFHGEGFPGRPGRFPALDAAAEALGISEDQLADALRDGSTIAEVALAEGVDVQAVIDAMVAEAGAQTDDEVAEGDVDAEEAAELKAELPGRIADLVDGELPAGPPFGGRGGPGHPGGGPFGGGPFGGGD